MPSINMVRSNLDLYPETWKRLNTLILEHQVPRIRLLRSMIELVLSDPALIERSISMSRNRSKKRV